MKNLILIFISLISTGVIAQTGNVGINTTDPEPSAALDVHGSNGGVLFPRLSLTSNFDTTTITAPVEGLVVYNQNDNGCDLKQGMYVYDGTYWRPFSYKKAPVQSRLIYDFIGVSNVSFFAINSNQFYGSVLSLFNEIDETFGASFHAQRTSTTQDWGFGISLSEQYAITEVAFDGRNDCCTSRLNNVVVKLYSCGNLVFTSSPINSAVQGLNTLAVGGVLADEIRIVVPNGGTTGLGSDEINFTELLVRGSN